MGPSHTSPSLTPNTRIYHTPKPENILQLIPQNVNGLDPSSDTKLHNLAQPVSQLQIDILCFQDMHIAFDALPQI